MYKPQAFTEKKRKARKQHKCCDCPATINIGDYYVYSSGIWDHEPDSFKQCLECSRMFKVASNLWYEYKIDDEYQPSFGDLREWISEFFDYHDGSVEIRHRLNIPDTYFWRNC